MRIFVSGLRDLVGAALREQLVPKKGAAEDEEEKHTIVGTVAEGEGAPPGVSEVAPIGSAAAEDLAASADVVFTALSGDLAEAKAVISGLRRAGRPEGEQVVVAASSVLTWDKTPRPEEGGLVETAFKSRRPAARYADYKAVESHVMSLAGENRRSHVVAGGILYGGGENPLHPLFREAWLSEVDAVGIPAVAGNDGSNVLPMVHVGDLARVMIAMWKSPPDEPPAYIVAVDGARSTLKEVVEAVATALGPGKTRELSAEGAESLLIDDPSAADLQTNMTFEVEEAVAHTLEVEWAHKEGLVEHAADIAAEYVKARNTRPVRVALVGPPAAGKSSLGAALAKKYYVEHVTTAAAVEQVKAGDDELAAEVSTALEGAADGRLPTRLLAKAVRAVLSKPRLRNRGWILDGLPRNWGEAEALFTEPLGEDEEEPADEEGAEPRAVDPTILPNGVVLLDGSDEFLGARIRALDQAEVEGTHNTEDGFQRRLATWKEANGAENPKSTVSWFESRAGIETMEVRVDAGANGAAGAGAADSKDGADDEKVVDVDASVAALVAELEPYVEKGGKPFNYHPTPEEIAAEEREAELKRREAAEKARAEEVARLEAEREEREAREAEEAARLLEIEKQEAELLEQRSEPLRRYLMDNVIPRLTEGLIEVCEVQPDDPVDYLAEYMFKAAAPDDEGAERDARARSTK